MPSNTNKQLGTCEETDHNTKPFINLGESMWMKTYGFSLSIATTHGNITWGQAKQKAHEQKRQKARRIILVVRKNHRTKFFSLLLLDFPVRHHEWSPPVFRGDQWWNKFLYQLSLFGMVFCNALLPYFIHDVTSRAIFQEPVWTLF